MSNIPSSTDTPHYDAVVVGGGLGGVSAALRLAESGASVLLLEAGEALGGTALHSGGGVHIWGARTWEEYQRRCPTADPHLARVLYNTFLPYVQWLEETGAPGAYTTTTLRGLTLTKYQIGDGIAPQGKRQWFRFVHDRLLALGARVETNTRAVHLRRLASGNLEIEGQTHDAGELRARASRVVLATGGYQADGTRLREQYGSSADEFIIRSVAHNVGDGLEMAHALGAAETDDLHGLYGHLMPTNCAISWTNHIDPILLSAFYAGHGIVLNADGKRFVDEGAGELNGETINASAHQPPGGLWVVVDEDVRRNHAQYALPPEVLRLRNLRYGWLLPLMRLRRSDHGREVVIDSLRYARQKGATLVRAQTIEELGCQLDEHGVDGARAVETIATYNDPSRSSTAGTTVARTNHHALTRPPFTAIRVGVGVSMTYGGVAIDASARALGPEGQPVPGLYAVPGTAGGVFTLHYGGALASTGVFGMVAADHILADGGRSGAAFS